jgi:hypothetical protein
MDDVEQAQHDLLMTVATVLAAHPEISPSTKQALNDRMLAVNVALREHEVLPDRRKHSDPSRIPNGIDRRRAAKTRSRIKGRPAPAGS